MIAYLTLKSDEGQLTRRLSGSMAFPHLCQATNLSLQVNPYLFLPSLALSTSTFEAIFLTLMFAFEGEFAQLSKSYAFT